MFVLSMKLNKSKFYCFDKFRKIELMITYILYTFLAQQPFFHVLGYFIYFVKFPSYKQTTFISEVPWF